jgi:hypothetical protein
LGLEYFCEGFFFFCLEVGFGTGLEEDFFEAFSDYVEDVFFFFIEMNDIKINLYNYI